MAVSFLSENESNRLPRSERTRRRLLDAGLRLFADHGPDAVTSHAIASSAGFASGTFYLHFKHKQALFQELADEAARELDVRLAATASAGGNPRETVEQQSRALVAFAEEHRDLFRIVFPPGGEATPTGARVLERLAGGIRARRRAALAAGRAWDCLDADVVAQALIGMWLRVLRWWSEDPSRASRDSIVQTLTHLQLHGSRPVEATTCSVATAADAKTRRRPDTTRTAPRTTGPRGGRRR